MKINPVRIQKRLDGTELNLYSTSLSPKRIVNELKKFIEEKGYEEKHPFSRGDASFFGGLDHSSPNMCYSFCSMNLADRIIEEVQEQKVTIKIDEREEKGWGRVPFECANMFFAYGKIVRCNYNKEKMPKYQTLAAFFDGGGKLLFYVDRVNMAIPKFTGPSKDEIKLTERLAGGKVK